MKKTKAAIIAGSILGTVALYALFHSRQMGLCEIHCAREINQYQDLFFFFPIILVFSVTASLSPERVFTAWWEFARIAIPFILAITFIISLELHHHPGGWMNLDEAFDLAGFLFLYALFTLGSMIQIVRGYYGLGFGRNISILVPVAFLIVSDGLYLTYYFLEAGGHIIFCHEMVFSPAYSVCRESIESYYPPILILSVTTAILGFVSLLFIILNLISNNVSFRKFTKYFWTIAIILSLLGCIPIKYCLGFLGCTDIFLVVFIFPLCIWIYVVVALWTRFYYPIWKILVAAVIISFILAKGQMFAMDILESIASHDSRLDQAPVFNFNKRDCSKFWFEKYKERCEDENKKRR